MGVLLIIVIAIIILVVYSNNKEKERQERQRGIDAADIRKNYNDGYREWLWRKSHPSPWIGSSYATYSIESQYSTNDQVLAHKDEIIKIHEEITRKRREDARKDEAFEKKQKEFNDKGIFLAKKHMSAFGWYHYDIEWKRRKANGGWDKQKFMLWQYFADSTCFETDIDYSLCQWQKQNADNLSQFKAQTRCWNQSVYDPINNFLTQLANICKNSLVVAFVDNKDGWDKAALEYHLKKIKRDTSGVTFVPLSELSKNDFRENSDSTALVIVDVFTENSQLKYLCERISDKYDSIRPAIAYLSLMKCYDKEEMQEVVENAKKGKEVKDEAYEIIRSHPEGATVLYHGVSKDNMSIEDAKHIIEDKDRIISFDGINERLDKAVSGWKKLYEKPFYFFYWYYPMRYTNVTEQSEEAREMIYDFKEGEYSEVLNIVEEKIKDTFGHEDAKGLTFACIPASSKERTNRRYADFASELRERIGLVDAMPHITVISDREAAHLTEDHHGGVNYSLDRMFFKDRRIVVFDDVVTRGRSMQDFIIKVEEAGGKVVCAMSIGKTFSDFGGKEEQPHPWTGKL